MSDLSLTFDLPLDPTAAFDVLVDELVGALARYGLGFEPGAGGRVRQGASDVGRVIGWQAGRSVRLEWRAAPWDAQGVTEVELRCEPFEAGTRVTLAQQGLGPWLGDGRDLAGWFAGVAAAPLLHATTPQVLGDWLTDRRARRPSGAAAREVYARPLYHYPNFRVILNELALAPSDYLLEVGCGGGALMHDALQSGCRAAGVDHSPDMLRVALAANQSAVESGRLVLARADAHRLPFAGGVFNCAAMTGVLGFLQDALAALGEMRRVLRPGGRIVVLSSDPRWRGTPAAPEPIASHLHFYGDDELAQLARAAGFGDVQVVRRDLEPYARESGIPVEHLPLFAGPGAPFLLARR